MRPSSDRHSSLIDIGEIPLISCGAEHFVVECDHQLLVVRACRPDGILPDGRPFLDLTSQLVGGVLAPGQTVNSREIQFLNQSGQRFSYSLKTFGKLNLAPSSFTSTPVVSIEAGKNYRYQPTVDEPEGQPLRFSKVTGPDSMQVDSATGLVTWATTPELIGSHRVTLRGLDQGDINGDGILDLVVLYAYDQPSVGERYRLRIATMVGNGDGGFNEPQIIYQHSIGTSGFSVRNLMLRDLNNDGYLDVIAVERERDPRLITLLNNGDGSFAAPIEQRYAPKLSDFRIADIDEDGVLDLIGRTAVLGFGASYNAVWLKGLGDGTFNEPTIIAPAGGDANCCYDTQARPYDVLDLNGDGHLDLALLITDGGLQIYHSDGAGNFTHAVDFRPSHPTKA